MIGAELRANATRQTGKVTVVGTPSREVKTRYSALYVCIERVLCVAQKDRWLQKKKVESENSETAIRMWRSQSAGFSEVA